jgi:PAS domain S-box-containing protein
MYQSEKIIYEQVINSSKVGTWVWNVQTGSLNINRRWAEIVGYTPIELEPIDISTWKNLTHPEDLIKSNIILDKHFKGEIEYYQCEVRMRHKDGHWVWIKDDGKVVEWTEKGEPLIASGIHQDISEYKKSVQLLENQNKFLQTAALISKKFILNDNLNINILEAFEKIAPYTDASRIYIFMLDYSKETMSNTHEWCKEGVIPEKDILQNLPLNVFPWWINKLKKQELINIPDVSKMSNEAKAERELLQIQGVKSILVLPIFTKNVFSGYIGFDNVETTGAYSDFDVKVLEMLSNIISNAIEKEENEKALSASIKNLDNFFNLPVDFVFVLDEFGNIVDVNNNVQDKLGYSKIELIGKPVTVMHDPDEANKANFIVEEMIAGTLDYCAIPLVSKAGKKTPVQTRIVKSVWNGENAIIGISKDVSSLMESEEKFSKAFYDVPVLFGIVEKDSLNFIEVNETFCDTLGLKLEKIKGKRLNNFIEYNANDERIFLELLEKNNFVKNYKLHCYNSSGSYTLLVSATNILIKRKKHILLSAIDVSEQQKLITELIIAKEKAEESDRLKSSFLATINHELRTPLNHILGFSDLISDIVEDSKIKQFAGFINKSGKSLLAIIEDIFELALLEQSKVTIRSEKVFVRDLYLDLKKELQETLNASGKNNSINIDCKLDSTLADVKINTDKYKVKQVMSNLIKNAIKFTHKGTINLKITTCNKECLTILIKDSGIGIPKNKQQLIFDFFRQADDSHTRVFDGVGIGLAISKKIAHAIGGEILVSSELGKGAEFKFLFPTIFEDQIEIIEKDVPLNIPNLSNKTFLIVEDDLMSIDLTEKILKLTECKILKAFNGQEAISLFLEHPEIDLILMDVKMPKMNGYEATREIRKTNKEIPIIALTAYTLIKDNEKAIESGCTDVVSKPIIKDILFNKINKYLNN